MNVIHYCLVWLGLKKPEDEVDSTMDARLTWRALIAEYLGTLFLVLLGTMSTIHPPGSNPFGAVTGPFAGGFAVGTIVKAIAHVSGGHINPAVSIGFFTCRRMTLVKTLLYIFAQSLGAITGSAILQALSVEYSDGMLGVTVLATQITSVQGLAIEIIITFMLVFLIVSTTDGGRQDVSGSVPLAIGIYIVGAAFAAGPLTGGSMNPARSLGPAVITGHWKAHWVYWAGPLAGGALAGLLYSNLFDAKYVVEPENEDADTPAPLASPPVRTQQAPYHLQGIHYQPEESYNSRRIINSYDAKGAKF